jgi:glutaredoxin
MHAPPLLISCALLSLAGPALAQYKVVTPDGRVTYTDRQPVGEPGKVTTLGNRAAAAPAPAGPDVGLPFALRQVVGRYPVTLYTGANCIPCDNGRQLLQQRGVPYTERSILTAEDTAALERLTGGRSIPALMVGTQPLRGFNPTDWASTLDAAGYPRESRLPRGWQPPAVAPLVAREAPPAPATEPTPPAPARAQAPPPAEAASGIRF